MHWLNLLILLLGCLSTISLFIISIKLKYSYLIAFLTFLPFVNFAIIIYIAFSKSPLEREIEKLKNVGHNEEAIENGNNSEDEQPIPIECVNCGAQCPEWMEKCIVCGHQIK